MRFVLLRGIFGQRTKIQSELRQKRNKDLDEPRRNYYPTTDYIFPENSTRFLSEIFNKSVEILSAKFAGNIVKSFLILLDTIFLIL